MTRRWQITVVPWPNVCRCRRQRPLLGPASSYIGSRRADKRPAPAADDPSTRSDCSLSS